MQKIAKKCLAPTFIPWCALPHLTSCVLIRAVNTKFMFTSVNEKSQAVITVIGPNQLPKQQPRPAKQSLENLGLTGLIRVA